MPGITATDKAPPPLFVDLDGSLIDTDLLFESFFSLLRTRPLLCLLVPFWLLRGKAYMKHRIAQHAGIDAASIPYNRPFLEYLEREAAGGRELVLATASSEALAGQVAEHLGIFAGVIASDTHTNVSGIRKLQKIREWTGDAPFDYAANGKVDLAIWRHARKALLVNPAPGVERAAARITDIEQVFAAERVRLMAYAGAMRMYQWLKNLLLFVPLLTAHKFTDLTLISHEILAFLAFSLCSSGVYVLNDLLDLPADRAHPRKRKRPFAAGTLPLSHGLVMACLLPLLGLGIGYSLSAEFLGILLLYLAMTSAYSIRFKAHAVLDVLMLAALYTLRVFAGAVVIQVTLSFWLFAFSIFIFLSLALVKRCSELVTMTGMDKTTVSGRGYRVSDLIQLQVMGIASGYISILVVALFINSPDVVGQYTHPQLLWILCPTLLFWVSQVWLKTGRGEMHDDPLIFTVRDRGSRIVALICIL
ncbi:MAG: UbiA family prenyltransferase, partial [Gammaproteobacteria bacterium]